MGDRHALRRPGRPRGVDHIRQLPRPHRRRRPAGTGHRPAAAARSSGHQHRHAAPAPQPRRRRPGQRPAPRAGISQHERQPRRRVARIHRQVRRPRLPHRQQRGHQLRADRSRHHRHHRLRARARAPASSRASRPARRVQLPVTDTPRPRTPPRPHPGTAPPAPRTAPAPSRRHRHRRVIPPRQHLRPLRRVQHLHLAQRGVRGLFQRGDQARPARCSSSAHTCAGSRRRDRVDGEPNPAPGVIDRDRQRVVGPVLGVQQPDARPARAGVLAAALAGPGCAGS